MLERDSTYGFASHVTVENAIEKRLSVVNADNKQQLAQILSEAVAALLAVNSAIPVHSRHRHLISDALEKFADGPQVKDTRTQS